MIMTYIGESPGKVKTNFTNLVSESVIQCDFSTNVLSLSLNLSKPLLLEGLYLSEACARNLSGKPREQASTKVSPLGGYENTGMRRNSSSLGWKTQLRPIQSNQLQCRNSKLCALGKDVQQCRL